MLKTKISILLLLLSGFSFAQESLTEIVDFGKNPGNLKMYSHVPNNLNHSKPIPLIVVAHGCTQSAEIISNATGWNKLADSLNLIIVYPEQKQINNMGKCFNFFVGFKVKKDKGEVASIKQMINYSFKYYNIDSSKVFITGMSAGGAISNAMLNAYPELFNAGAILSAPSNIFKQNNSAPNKQPRIAIIQGDKDKIIPKGNADKILAQWIKKNELIDSNYIFEQEFLNHPLLSSKSFYDSENRLKIISISAKDVKHKVLISPGKGIHRGGIMESHTLDINFHSTYWIAQFFGLIQPKN